MQQSTFRSYFTKSQIPLNMNYGRKIFATYLRNKGIEPEIIDLLQGRIGSSVFVNHYYRPDIKEIITKKIKPPVKWAEERSDWLTISSQLQQKWVEYILSIRTLIAIP